MRVRRWLVMALSMVVIAACGGGGDLVDTTVVTFSVTSGPTSPALGSNSAEPEPWGEVAIAWWDAMGEAAAEGSEHMMSFLADDLVWEDRVWTEVARGQQEWLDVQLERHGGPFPWIDAEILVSADELLGRFTKPVGSVVVPFLDRLSIGPEGVSRWVTAAAFASCRAYEPWRCESDVDGLVDSYVALWNGAAGVAAASVYASGADISDSLLGESVSGLGAIEQSVASGSWPHTAPLVVTPLRHGDGREVHFALSETEWAGPEEIRFLVDLDDGSGCPGRMGVVLAVEGDRVIWERRYHDIMSVRNCYDSAELVLGWWDQMEPPDTVIAEKTGTVTYRDMAIEVYNGTPELDRFLEWGLSRFEAAGLPLPEIEAVTFLQARVTCLDKFGVATTTEQGGRVILCLKPDDICADQACESWTAYARQCWLHELAHPWLNHLTDEDVRAEFLDVVGLPRWSDVDDPWGRRGAERAANTLRFGLMDEPVTLVPELHGDCDERDAGFRVLTGTDPIAECTP